MCLYLLAEGEQQLQVFRIIVESESMRVTDMIVIQSLSTQFAHWQSQHAALINKHQSPIWQLLEPHSELLKISEHDWVNYHLNFKKIKKRHTKNAYKIPNVVFF